MPKAQCKATRIGYSWRLSRIGRPQTFTCRRGTRRRSASSVLTLTGPAAELVGLALSTWGSLI
jgi:hypothetical protein